MTSFEALLHRVVVRVWGLSHGIPCILEQVTHTYEPIIRILLRISM